MKRNDPQLQTGAAFGVALFLFAATFASASTDLCDQGQWQTESQVILLGEVHDNPLHHDIQACAIAAIAPSALEFEMVAQSRVEALTEADREDADQLEASLLWEASGWPDFRMYYPIFTAAPQAEIFGAAIPRETLRAVFETGAAPQFEGDAAMFGLDAALPEEEQEIREQMQFEAHCEAMPADMMGGMVAAQRLRDAELARMTLNALDQTGGPVVVILGNGHARYDWGVPVYLRAVRPDLRLLSVGQVETTDAAPDAAGHAFDRVLFSDPIDRPDPCDAFRQAE